MAHSPVVLAGSLELSRAMKQTQLERTLSERLSIAAPARLGCQTCLDAHMEAARCIDVGADGGLRPRPHGELYPCGVKQ